MLFFFLKGIYSVMYVFNLIDNVIKDQKSIMFNRDNVNMMLGYY